jgi:hypothetical protein
MNAGIVVVYSNHNDPVVGSLLKIAGVEGLHVDEISESLGDPLHIWNFSQKNAPIAKRYFPVFDQKLVINRVFTLKGTELSTGLRRLGFSDSWGNIIIKDLLKYSSKYTHDVGGRGVSMSLLPLHLQWFYADRNLKGIRTPKFAYAFGEELPDLEDLVDPFQKSIWSLFDWNEEDHLPATERNWGRFFVERPTGLPVVCYFLGEKQIEFMFPREKFDLDHGALMEAALALMKVFKSDIGELLFYREPDGSYKFYAFSPYLLTAKSADEFDDCLMRYVA